MLCHSGPYLLAHHEHVGAPQVLVGRLAVERVLEERCHSRRNGVAVKVVRFGLCTVWRSTTRQRKSPATIWASVDCSLLSRRETKMGQQRQLSVKMALYVASA